MFSTREDMTLTGDKEVDRQKHQRLRRNDHMGEPLSDD
jgi:hypothetical protein